ncbi:MAG: hypothetical protein GY773_19095 [Actinomycetia bacterium]|nr:hypothetical protein [Actinomycetes bacterium]
MNGGSDFGRWALEDDQLEALLSGVSPAAAGLVGNPVAEFFADVNKARGVATPTPDPSLRELFASDVPLAAPAGAALDPAAEMTDGEPVLDLSQPFETGETFDSAQTFDAGETFDGAQAYDPTQVVSPTPSVLGGTTPSPVELEGVPPAQTEALPFRRSLAEFATAEPKRRRVYRSSPIGTVAAVLRPTGTKLLMGVAMLVVSAVAVEALGLHDFPLLSTRGPETEISDIAADGGGGLAEEARLPTTGGPGDSGEATLLVPPTSTGDEAGAELPSSTSPAPATTTRREATTSVSLATTAAETTTTVTDTTTVVTNTSSTETVDPDTTSVSTTDVSTEPTDSTASTTSSTLGTTTTALAIAITFGQVHAVPGGVPAGDYGAIAPQGEGGCTVRIARSSGSDRIFNRGAGAFVSFTLFDKDTVLLSDGCPTVFAVS